MRYDIYFHNDFDGHAAAAVMLAFLRSRGDDIEHFVPVKYDIIPEWRHTDFFMRHKLIAGPVRGRNPAIIVDFPFHPGAQFWFDHHLLPFREPKWEGIYKKELRRRKQRRPKGRAPAPSPYWRYDESYRSACHLVYDSLKKDFGWR